MVQVTPAMVQQILSETTSETAASSGS